MTAWLILLALAMATLSAIALYAASPHCMWRALRGWPRAARGIGTVLALVSLYAWTQLFGIAAGLGATLASLMLPLVVQPYLAMFMGTPNADTTTAEKD